MSDKSCMHRSVVIKKSGFSLVELIVVIGIMGIVLAIAVPTFIEWREGLQFRQAGRDVSALIRTARARAISTNRQQRVEIDIVNRTYTARRGERAVNSPWGVAAEPVQQLPPARVGVASIGRTPANNANTYNLIVCNPNGTFQFDGNPLPAGVENRGVVITLFDLRANANANQNSQRYRVELTQTGRIMGSVVRVGDLYPPP